jgi:16S rRNA (cytosine1402-N4)-methyltransferase
MLREVLEYLNPGEGGTYIDATVGPGGHAEEILGRIGGDGFLLGIDRDREALALAAERLGCVGWNEDYEKVRDTGCVVRRAGFAELARVAGEAGIESADGVLFDFGVSMLQLRDPSRGFSFTSDAPLDMRMDDSGELTAREIVNTWSEKDLESILRDFGEEPRARRVARAITRERARSPITSCRELADMVGKALGRRGRTHPATRTFQALRLAVNDELGQIDRGLRAALGILAPGGRLVAISYHSLEDRAVKHFMKEHKQTGSMNILTKKPVTPGREEVASNPSARSAKLRAGEVL